MKRHYTRTTTGYRCVSCREDFTTFSGLGKHYGLRGKCKHPLSLGFTIDADLTPPHWTKAA